MSAVQFWNVPQLQDKHEILMSMRRNARNETRKMPEEDCEKMVWKTPLRRRQFAIEAME